MSNNNYNPHDKPLRDANAMKYRRSAFGHLQRGILIGYFTGDSELEHWYRVVFYHAKRRWFYLGQMSPRWIKALKVEPDVDVILEYFKGIDEMSHENLHYPYLFDLRNKFERHLSPNDLILALTDYLEGDRIDAHEQQKL